MIPCRFQLDKLTKAKQDKRVLYPTEGWEDGYYLQCIVVTQETEETHPNVQAVVVDKRGSLFNVTPSKVRIDIQAWELQDDEDEILFTPRK